MAEFVVQLVGGVVDGGHAVLAQYFHVSAFGIARKLGGLAAGKASDLEQLHGQIQPGLPLRDGGESAMVA